MKWILANLGVPISTAAITAVLAGIYMAGEVDADDYAKQRNAVAAADNEYRHLVAEALADGRLTRWENAGLHKIFWNHASALMVDGEPPGTPATERQELARAVNVVLPDSAE
uniref:hypothetical protein n=1 Tax=Cupriavidus gilardii TaxID=82541 RepID=UPI00247B0C5F|nr:hypothetical protein [Cupriavidus gilardii]